MGFRPQGRQPRFPRTYHVETEVARTTEFYDVRMRISWQILGRRAQTEYVRRLRQHVRTVEPTNTP